MKHTKEPWMVSDTTDIYTKDIKDLRQIADCNVGFLSNEAVHIWQDKANASRIALCVNKCAGITDEALESGALEFMSEVTVAYFNDNIESRNARDDIKLPLVTKETLTIDGVKVWEQS